MVSRSRDERRNKANSLSPSVLLPAVYRGSWLLQQLHRNRPDHTTILLSYCRATPVYLLFSSIHTVGIWRRSNLIIVSCAEGRTMPAAKSIHCIRSKNFQSTIVHARSNYIYSYLRQHTQKQLTKLHCLLLTCLYALYYYPNQPFLKLNVLKPSRQSATLYQPFNLNIHQFTTL